MYNTVIMLENVTKDLQNPMAAFYLWVLHGTDLQNFGLV